MLLTPPDVVSQILLAVPMWLLFEAGIIFSIVLTRNDENAELLLTNRPTLACLAPLCGRGHSAVAAVHGSGCDGIFRLFLAGSLVEFRPS